MASPIESLASPANPNIATAANFGVPVFDLIKATIGATTQSGFPDCNGGGPQLARQFQGGLVPYTNADATSINPGVQPIQGFNELSSHIFTVPSGLFLVITGFVTGDNSIVPIPPVTFIPPKLAGSFGVVGASLGTAAAGVVIMGQNTIGPDGATFLPVTAPIVVDQGTQVITTNYLAFTGYYTLRDPQINPVIKAIDNGANTYTVPANKTFWLLGAIARSSGAVMVQSTGGYPVAFPRSSSVAGQVGDTMVLTQYGSLQCPSMIPLFPTVVVSTLAGTATIWGIESN